ncbi:MAG: tRNA lysidine(34) synthetase TilS [Myxococcota bacterium]
MDPVQREVAAFLREQGVSRAAKLLVAVSGGADSVALLHALLGIGQRVEAAHVHHGLRGAEADADLAFVARLAHALGVPFWSTRVDAARRDGRSPEARARALRYQALEEIRARRGCAHLATAHHQDDQAETVLLRAVRGTGLAGLAAIRASLDGGRVLRPLLALRRVELRRYLAERGLAHRDDESNRDLSIPRNRVRAEILPVLESIHPGAATRLAALARLAAQAESRVGGDLEPWLDARIEPGEGGVWLDDGALAALDDAGRARAWLAIAARAGLAADLTEVHLARIDEFVSRAASGLALSLPRGFALVRERARLWLGPAPGPQLPDPIRLELPADGELEFPERCLRLSWHACTAPDPPARLLRLPASPGEALVARSPRLDDRIFTRGRERRLKDLFASARWGRVAQARALIVERGGEIVWVPGLWRGEKVTDGTGSRELRAVRLPSPPRSC